jgi:hypothetical protein
MRSASLWLVVLVAVVLAGMVGIVVRRKSVATARSAAGRSKLVEAPPRAAGLPPDASSGSEPKSQSGAGSADEPWASDPFAARARGSSNPWASVDLDAARAALPDNIYWRMSAPTRDPEILRQREEERARWNSEYGKVLSNTATEEEIYAYYAHRKRLSEDYIKFAGYLLNNYRKTLGEQDLSLLRLAIDMHLARLEEIPRQINDAIERGRAHEAARQAWLADQKAFEGTPGGVPENPER